MSTESPPPEVESSEGTTSPEGAVPPTPPTPAEIPPAPTPTVEEEVALANTEERLAAGAEAARAAQTPKPPEKQRSWPRSAARGAATVAGGAAATGVAYGAGGTAAVSMAESAVTSVASGTGFWSGTLGFAYKYLSGPLALLAGLFMLKDLPGFLEKIGKGEAKFGELFKSKGGGGGHAKKDSHGGGHAGGGHGGGGHH